MMLAALASSLEGLFADDGLRPRQKVAAIIFSMQFTSVEAWIASHEPSPVKDYREAGKAAGIYGVEEAVVMKAARREPSRKRG